MTWFRACAAAFWLFAITAAAVSAQEPPSAVAFVVGVQSYDEPALNRLQYTADDAEAVFDRLKAITRLDLDRSRLILADPDVPDAAQQGGPAWISRTNRLESGQLQDALRDFLRTIKSGDTVIFYLGGHGKQQANRVLFLTSDHTQDRPARYVSYNQIFDDIRNELDARELLDVSVVFFANMCNAGTAAVRGEHMGNEDQDVIEEQFREMARNHTLGFERFALFPASAPGQNTFEDPDLGRSIFAYHLLDGLGGNAAKDGIISAGRLFAHLDDRIPDELPRDPTAFDGTITIGVTRGMDARALYLNGLALASHALDTDDPLAWELASRDFGVAVDFSGGGPLRALATLRQAQVSAAGGSDPAEVARLLAQVTDVPATDPSTSEAAQALRDAAEASATAFAALLVTSAEGERRADLWRAFLKQLPGYSSLQTVGVTPAMSETERRQRLAGALAELKGDGEASDQPRHLVLVYSGSAGFASGRLFPFPVATYEELAAEWEGKVTLIHDAPFGGFLAESPILLGNATMVLAARQKNGMAFSSSSLDASEPPLLLDMLEEQVDAVETWDRFREYVKNYEKYLGESPASRRLSPEDQGLYGSEQWVIGTPAILKPSGSASPIFSDLKREALASLQPVRRLAFLLATGCDLGAPCAPVAPGPLETRIATESPAAALELMPLRPGPEAAPEPVYEGLKRAALLDFSGNLTAAFNEYHRFLDRHAAARQAAGGQAAAGEDALRAQAQEALGELEAQVRHRAEGLQAKMGREIWLLDATVSDYASPLVPDLAGPLADAKAWEKTLAGVLAGEEIAPGGPGALKRKRIVTASRQAFLASLDGAFAQTGPEDLVVFLYSGRGIEVGDERYLVLADDTAIPSHGRVLRPSGTGLEIVASDPTAGRVSLAEVAERVGDHWFLGIYDTQFTAPVFEAGRFDSVLDKHLDSVRPSPPETSAPNPVGSGPPRFVPGSEKALERHVHIWWEGRLTERTERVHGCPLGKFVRSPMSAALLAALSDEPHATYRDWVGQAQAHPCLAAPTGTLVAQGAVDLPRFASGNAATQISYFLGAGERRDANLRLAEQVTAAAAGGDHPLFALSHAAVVIARKQFERSTGTANAAAPMEVPAAVLDRLEGLHAARAARDDGLDDEALDLYTQALVLGGDSEQALQELLTAPASQLSSAALQGRLIELTEAKLRQSPASILDETRSQLERLGQAGAAPDAGIADKLRALASDFVAPRQQYRIAPLAGMPE